jgi:hypothetical protein
MTLLGVEKDLKLALHFFNMAAMNGYAPSRYSMGTFYQEGNIVPKDLAKAKEYYEAAAADGSYFFPSDFPIYVLLFVSLWQFRRYFCNA